jgi:hypothetical protein
MRTFPSIWLNDEVDNRKLVSILNYTRNISDIKETERSHIISGSERFAAIVIKPERNTSFSDSFEKLHHKRNHIFQGKLN